MEFFSNPWVTGIWWGIISWFIVYFVTNRVFYKKQDNEYSQKVKTANNELLYIMRPLIVQEQIPKREIMESIVNSTARKYEINSGDLLSLAFLADDLMREIMENAFLWSEQKIELCKKINEINVSVRLPTDTSSTYQRVIYQKGRISSQYVSMLLAATASMMFIVVTLSGELTTKNEFSVFSNSLLTATFVPLIALLTTMVMKRVRIIEQKMKQRNIKVYDDLGD